MEEHLKHMKDITDRPAAIDKSPSQPPFIPAGSC